MKQPQQNHSRQIDGNISRVSADTYQYEENDFFDAELAGNFKFECIVEKPIKSNRKTWFDRFGFRTYSEMRNCNEEGLQ